MHDKTYLEQLKFVLDNGKKRGNRTGVDTIGVFGMQARYDLREGFPALTTKKLFFKSLKAELLWFLEGSSDYKRLNELGSKIWDANAKADYWKPKAKFDGDVGRVYGVQWRSWRTPDGTEIDQIKNAIERIKTKPTDRRIIVSAWNPGEIDEMALPPCHIMFQFYVEENKYLSLQMYQRSADMFLGVPFNIASYSLLLAMIAQVTNLEPKEFIHVIGDAHIYENHIEQVQEQLSRKPYNPPELWLNPEIKDIDKFSMSDIKLKEYDYHPPIKADMAV
ncbi:thymidylate synthase [Candidatus Dojkabacteria bacterium]|uniref:Thymidylate synthase n=1 Tax=Candidatus Dojkabacteria bacterium TaxID=2099670 RepID=A0A955L0G5_9BACT|nr:thymidylate synthase [Candidatus Dojkabacteria bacterium]